MGEWHEVKTYLYKRGDCPCNGCQAGSASVSQKTEDGKLYEKFDCCQETCQPYRDWLEGNPQPLFGQHIREAYHILKR